MSDKNTFYKKARKKYEAKQFEDAVYWYTRTISVDGEDAEMYSERGVAFFHMGKLPESLDDLSRAQALEAENPYRYASRAYIRDAMGDLEGAITDYETALKLDPDDSVALNNLGMLEEKRGYHSKAKALFDFADKLDKDARASGETEDLRPKNIQREINAKSKNKSITREMKDVFTKKSAFKDFLTFIGNGFR
jgi:Flp pilus assembly protein TadD